MYFCDQCRKWNIKDGCVHCGKIRDYHLLKPNTFYLVTDSLGDQYTLYYRGYNYNHEIRDDELAFWRDETGDGLWVWNADEFQEAKLLYNKKEIKEKGE